jgi:hypothetical protein
MSISSSGRAAQVDASAAADAARILECRRLNIRVALKDLALGPFRRGLLNARPLKGQTSYRLRVGLVPRNL